MDANLKDTLLKFEIDPSNTAKLAENLRNPQGDYGRKVAKMMNEGNAIMIDAAITNADIHEGDIVLEIGFGNGSHLEKIARKVENGSVAAIDSSETMVQEASSINQSLIASGQLDIRLATIDQIPFDDDTFDKVITVNTIYFWEDNEKCGKEILRVLKKGGTVVIGLREKEKLKLLKFLKGGFTRYSIDEVEALMRNIGFSKVWHTSVPDKPADAVCVMAQK